MNARVPNPSPSEDKLGFSAFSSLRLFVLTAALLLVIFQLDLARGPLFSDDFPGPKTMETLARILEDSHPHPTGTPANRAVRDKILAELETAGLSPQVQTTARCRHGAGCVQIQNIVVEITGKRQDALLLSAHYDSAAASPGAGDDGAAVAVLIETAKHWAKRQPTNTLIVLFNDGEEIGLLGADAFMEEHQLARHVKAVLNFEARGTSGPAWLFETGPQSGQLLEAFAATSRHAYTSSLAPKVYALLSNATDVDVYSRYKLPSLNFAFIGGGDNYHTQMDNLANLSGRSMQSHGNNLWPLLERLAEAKLERKTSNESIFFSVFGRMFIVPIPWMVASVALSTILLCASLWRKPQPALPLVVFSQLCFVFGALVVALVTVELMNFSSSAVTSWQKAPMSSTLAVTFLLLGWASEWKKLNDFILLRTFEAAASITLILLSVASLMVLPEASYLFCIPALANTIAALLSRSNTTVLPFAFTFMVVLSLWFPVCAGVFDALGLNAAPVLGLSAAFIILPLVPLLPAPSPNSRAIAIVPIALALTLIAASSPTADQKLRRINLHEFIDIDQRTTTLSSVRVSPAPLPEDAKNLRSLSRTSSMPPWSGDLYPTVKPLLEEPPLLPDIRDMRHVQNTVELTLGPAEDIPSLGLAFDESSGVRWVEADGRRLQLSYSYGWASIRFTGFTKAIRLTLPDEAFESTFYLFGERTTLSKSFSVIQQERDAIASPIGYGDRMMAYRIVDGTDLNLEKDQPPEGQEQRGPNSQQ